MNRCALLILALAVGCASEEPKPSPPPAKPAAPAPAPAPSPVKKTEAPPPVDDAPIVIKGSGGSATHEKPARDDAHIRELKEKAAASQRRAGEPEPEPTPRADVPPPPKEKEGGAKRRELANQIASYDSKIKALNEEKAGLMEKRRVRQGRLQKETEVATDPERVAAIDAEIAQLDAKKAEVQADLAKLDGGRNPGGSGPRPPGPPPGPPPGSRPSDKPADQPDTPADQPEPM